jgi:AraC-like DNA-binding protein
MTRNDVRNNINHNIGLKNIHNRRESVFSSSDAKIDDLAIDCILVYNRNVHNDDKKNNDQSNLSRSELRKRFQEYLVKKQDLIVEEAVRII